MSRSIVVAAFLCTGLVTACGGGSGGSGVSGSKTLVSLSDGEITDLCEYSTDLAGPARVVDCGGGIIFELTPKTVAECTAQIQSIRGQFPGCTATVSASESCTEDLADLTDAQLCSDFLPVSCQTLSSAACGGL